MSWQPNYQKYAQSSYPRKSGATHKSVTYRRHHRRHYRSLPPLQTQNYVRYRNSRPQNASYTRKPYYRCTAPATPVQTPTSNISTIPRSRQSIPLLLSLLKLTTQSQAQVSTVEPETRSTITESLSECHFDSSPPPQSPQQQPGPRRTVSFSSESTSHKAAPSSKTRVPTPLSVQIPLTRI